jgi:hypothetical protein
VVATCTATPALGEGSSSFAAVAFPALLKELPRRELLPDFSTSTGNTLPLTTFVWCCMSCHSISWRRSSSFIAVVFPTPIKELLRRELLPDFLILSVDTGYLVATPLAYYGFATRDVIGLPVLTLQWSSL